MAELDRIIAEMPRRFALSELIGYCQGLVKSGSLQDPSRQSLIELIDKTCTSFDMPTFSQLVSAEGQSEQEKAA